MNIYGCCVKTTIFYRFYVIFYCFLPFKIFDPNFIIYSPFDEILKKSFRCTPLGTKVVIYHLVGNFMLKSMDNVASLGTCAEIL